MLKSINKVIKVLVSSDLFLNAGWGLLAPVFAIFIMEDVAAQNVAQAAKVAGFASLIYWVVKSVLQIPLGKYLDRSHGEKDDFWFMFLGTLLVGLIPFGFIFSFRPWHIYVLQMLHGAGMAMALVAWCAIFTRHIDQGQEAFEWGLDSTALGLSAGIAGAVGGIVGALWGFRIIFGFVGGLTLVAACLLLLIRKEMSSKDRLSHPKTPPRTY